MLCPRARRAWRDRDLDDGGFSLVDTLVAMAVLGILLLMSVPAVLMAQATAARAATTDELRSQAQLWVEEIRALSYDDIGTTTGTPVGVVESSRTVSLNGRTVVLESNIRWEGVITGLAMVDEDGDGDADLGDGVAGFQNSGVDYKAVSITAYLESDPGQSVEVTTIIAAEELGSTTVGAVLINLIKDEDPATPTPDSDWPVTYLVYPDGRWAAPLSAPGEQQVLVDFDDPDQTFDIRLGPLAGDMDDGTWRLREDYQVAAGSNFLAETTVFVYRMITLDLSLQTPTGAPITDSSVAISGDDITSYTLDTGDMSEPGRFVTTADDAGRPLGWGTYSLNITAPGYETLALDIDAPAGYPDDVVHEETITLVPLGGTTTTSTSTTTTTTTVPPSTTTTTAPGSTTTTTTTSTTTTTTPTLTGLSIAVTDGEGWEVGETDILVDSPTLGQWTVATDADGNANVNLVDGEAVTLTLSNDRGFSTTVHGVTPTGVTDSVSLALAVPSNGKIVHSANDHDADMISYKGRYWPFEDQIEMIPSSLDRVSYVINDSTDRWRVYSWCAGESDYEDRNGMRYSNISSPSNQNLWGDTC